MGSPPTYVISGASRTSTLQGLKIDALLSNLPEILKSEASAQKIKGLHASFPSSSKILDSGGKQIFDVTSGRSKTMQRFVSEPTLPVYRKNTLNLHPYHLGFAMSRFKFDIVQALDHPLPVTRNPREREEAFYGRIDLNLRWALESIRMRDKHSTKTQIFLPFQGYTTSHLDIFLKGLGKATFDGISLPTRAFNIDERIMLLMAFHQRGVRRVHVLGSSSFETVALLSFLAKNDYFDFVSFDSSTWRVAADKGKFLIPFDLRDVKLHQLSEWHIANNRRFCTCKWCRSRSPQRIALLPWKEQRPLLSLHNFMAINKLKNELFEHADSPDSIREFLLARSTRVDVIERITRQLEYIQSGRYFKK